MQSIALSIYLDSEFGVPREMQGAGTSLENPYVYDEVAREIKAMADRGLVEIVGEKVVQRAGEPLIDRLAFKRLR